MINDVAKNNEKKKENGITCYESFEEIEWILMGSR
jgi:hypothetical protein